MSDTGLCDERHENIKVRFDSQSKDIDRIFDSRVPWRVFYWTLGIAFTLIFGSYAYTKTVSNEVSDILTKGDMQKISEDIIKAIKEK
jgi:hypothetical protein